jgi:hypothetical protein
MPAQYSQVRRPCQPTGRLLLTLKAGLVTREKADSGSLPTPKRVKIVARPYTIPAYVDGKEAL